MSHDYVYVPRSSLPAIDCFLPLPSPDFHRTSILSFSRVQRPERESESIIVTQLLGQTKTCHLAMSCHAILVDRLGMEKTNHFDPWAQAHHFRSCDANWLSMKMRTLSGPTSLILACTPSIVTFYCVYCHRSGYIKLAVLGGDQGCQGCANSRSIPRKSNKKEERQQKRLG